MDKQTVEEWAHEYVKTVNGPTNGHGQCVHPIHGRSDFMMRQMFQTFGTETSNKAIDEEFKKCR